MRQQEDRAAAPAEAPPPAHDAPARRGPTAARQKKLATASEDRRIFSRRKAPDQRIDPEFESELSDQPWLPVGWRYLPLVMLLVMGTCLAQARHLPTTPALLLMLVGIGSTSVMGWVRRFETRLSGWSHLLLVATTSVLPLLLFAFGVASWVGSGLLSTNAAVGALVGTAAVAAVFSRCHPGLVFATQIALWGPAIIVEQSLAGLMGLAVGALAGVLVVREHVRLERREEAQRQARIRISTRARDILSDYEEAGQGWFWETDRRSLLTYISRPVADLLGHEVDDLIGQHLKVLFDPEQEQESERTLGFHLSARSAFQDIALRAAVEGEDERWWSVTGRPVYDEFDNFVGFRGSGIDLTEKRRSQEQVTRLAAYDSLTGLANRFQMSEALGKILAAPQDMRRCCAVFLLDLDRFKQVNDTLGHPAGDSLLKQVAERLERTIGKTGRVGRLGGDEFQIIIPNRVERRRLGEIAERIIHAISQPYSIDGHTAVIGTSIGIALAPADGTSSEDLIRNADLALYAAKDHGRGRYHFYAKEMHAEAEERSLLEKDLRLAIAHGELELHYQPVVATATEQISGFEALIRWRNAERGWVSPERFVTIAEDSGLISQLGEWALRTACRDLAEWPEEVRCAVNVSPLQFANPNLPAVLTSAIAHAGVAPSRLELEITESVFLNDDEGTEAMFAALKGIGVRLVLDDFGTGYSSLGYLKKAPFDKIKIDQSFVRGATQPGSRNGAIIASITSLAQNLGMDTTAEGVETLDELDLVRMHGCSHVQGFIYEQPLPAEQARERLASGLAAVARGPRSARASRQMTLRKVLLDHQGQIYNGIVRNISEHGALIEGLWNVPVGTVLQVQLAKGASVVATARWSHEGRTGFEFASPNRREAGGARPARSESGDAPVPLKRAG